MNQSMIRSSVLMVLIISAISCGNESRALTSTEAIAVRDSARLLTESIAKNVSREGPVAWLRYFEDSGDFFMASQGQLVFPDHHSASEFINGVLIKRISKIELRWSNVRIDPLTTELAGIAAGFHEDITDSLGKTVPYEGYFTAMAHKTSKGWHLRNAHWSMILKP